MVPDVIGWPEEEALAHLAAAGYGVEREFTGPVAPDATRRVVRQRLLADGRVALLLAAPPMGKGGAGLCPTALRKNASPAASVQTNAPTGQSAKGTILS